MTADSVMDGAFARLRQQRAHHPADADVWSFRRDWSQHKTEAEMRARRSRFTPLACMSPGRQ